MTRNWTMMVYLIKNRALINFLYCLFCHLCNKILMNIDYTLTRTGIHIRIKQYRTAGWWINGSTLSSQDHRRLENINAFSLLTNAHVYTPWNDKVHINIWPCNMNLWINADPVIKSLSYETISESSLTLIILHHRILRILYLGSFFESFHHSQPGKSKGIITTINYHSHKLYWGI